MSLISSQTSTSSWQLISSGQSLSTDDDQSLNDSTQTDEADFEVITRAFIEEISGPEGLAEFDRIAAFHKEEPPITWYATFSNYALGSIGWSSQTADANNGAAAINIKILEKLGALTEDSITNNPEVLHLIETYADKRGLNLDRIRKYTITGENIAKLLFSPDYKADNGLKLELDGEEHTVPCDIETTRALSWYVMASAASQDVLRKHREGGFLSDLLDSGSIIMKDPDSRIFNFLTSNKDSYYRISSHFHERAGHNASFLGSPLQRGIDDNNFYLPCDGGTLLFDVLKSDSKNTPELFMKFEKHGLPLPTSHQAFITWIGHASEYLKTRSAGGYKDGDNLRQEHTYKGFLKAVHEQIKELIGLAGKENIIAPAEAGEFLASIKKVGIIQIRQFIKENLRGEASDTFKAFAMKVIKEIDDNVKALGFASDQYGIERRGAEVHISLNPADVYKNINTFKNYEALSSPWDPALGNPEEEVKTDGTEAYFPLSYDRNLQPQADNDVSSDEDASESENTIIDENVSTSIVIEQEESDHQEDVPSNLSHDLEPQSQADDDVSSDEDASESENTIIDENVSTSIVIEHEESDDEEEDSYNLSHDLEPQPQAVQRQVTPVAAHIQADDDVSSDEDASESENTIIDENVSTSIVIEREESDDEEEASSNLSHDLEPQPQAAERQATPVAMSAPMSTMAQNASSSDSAINPVSNEEDSVKLNAQEPADSDNLEQSHAGSVENIENAAAPPAEESSASPPSAGFFSRLFSFPRNLFQGLYDLLSSIGNRIWRFFKG